MDQISGLRPWNRYASAICWTTGGVAGPYGNFDITVAPIGQVAPELDAIPEKQPRH